MTKLEMLEQEKEELKNMQECLGYLQVFVESGLGNALIQKKNADDIDFSTVFYTNASVVNDPKYVDKTSDDAKVRVVELISKELQKSIVNVDEVIKTK